MSETANLNTGLWIPTRNTPFRLLSPEGDMDTMSQDVIEISLIFPQPARHTVMMTVNVVNMNLFISNNPFVCRAIHFC